MLKAIIVGGDGELVRYVRQVCAEFKDIYIYKVLDGTARPHDVAMALASYEPDVAFVDITELEGGCLASYCLREILTRQLRTVAVPFSRRGVEGNEGEGMGTVLTPPFTGEQFERAVREALSRREKRGSPRVVAFQPAKPGAGASTLAVNVAGVAAGKYGKKTLFIEADMKSGTVSYLFNLEASGTLGEAFVHPERLGDRERLGVVNRSHGMDILPACGPMQGGTASRWDLFRLLRVARENYEVVVVDLGEGIDEVAEAVIGEADQVAMVCTPELASVNLVRRRLWEIETARVRQRHVRLVVNRYGEGEGDVMEVQRVTRLAVAATVGEDSRAVKEAWQNHTLLRADTGVGRDVAQVASLMLQLEAPGEDTGKGMWKRVWRGLTGEGKKWSGMAGRDGGQQWLARFS